jgi:hypothetical protein
MLADIYHPEIWNGFFQLVGASAAALTGLIFVSMSLNPQAIIQDANHRNRAICNLTGFIHVFMICALAIIGGQNHRAVGAEWLTVASIAEIIYINGYIQARKGGRSSFGLGIQRLIIGIACYMAEMMAAIILIFGHITGIYVASIAMMSNIVFFISGAWLIMVGVQLDSAKQQNRLQNN